MLSPRVGPFHATLVALALCLALGFTAAQPSVGWDMRVCAPPDQLPASNEAGEGYQNRIAQILAEELGAQLSYEWAPASAYGVHHNLRTGACDLMFGVAESASGLLNTVPYTRIPFAFVFRAEGGFAVTSLLDPALADYAIAVPPNGLLHKVLQDLGHGDALRLIAAERTRGGAEAQAPLVRTVLDGDADVAMMIASDAAYFVSRHPDVLAMEVVTPEIVPPLSQMFEVSTIGVRPGDEAFRDRLNIALATAWDDVQAVYESYAIPTLPVPRPLPPQPLTPEPVRVGVVLPIPTPNPLPSDDAANAARIGADTADDLIGRDAERSGAPLRVYLASAPTPESALRAAHRLASTEDIHALVGGIGEGHAAALAGWSESSDTLFLNVGAPDQAMRTDACGARAFHVEASDAMYLDATYGWYAARGSMRWHVVHETSSAGRERLELARSRLAQRADLDLTGTTGVAEGFASYATAIDEVVAAAPDAVLLLLDPEQQELFLSQIDRDEHSFVVTGLTPLRAQTRDFLIRLRQSAPRSAQNARAMLWDPTVAGEGERFNAVFTSRSGEPADAAGWAAYAAIKIAYETARDVDRRDTDAMVDHLEQGSAFDVHKGIPASFRAATHQLAQPLFLVSADPEAPYGLEVSRRIAVGRVVGSVPELSAPASALDILGVAALDAPCTSR